MRVLCFLVCTLPLSVFAQFVDDFSDGDFTSNPAWTGDVAKFEVDGSFQLHLNAPAVTDDAFLSTASGAIIHAEWTFWLMMDFNPSSNNFADIFLVSNASDLTGSLNGYFVRCGGTDDEVSLYRRDAASNTEIIDGTDDKLNTSSVNVRVRITRDSLGNWELFSDTSGGTNYVSEGTAFDNTHLQSSFFGVRCNYTSTRSDKFFFDDFNVTGQPFVDNVKPIVIYLNPLSSNQLDVHFSELLETTSAETLSNYSVDNGVGNPSAAQLDALDSSQVHLTFGTPFVNGFQHMLSVSGVTDRATNAMDPAMLPFSYFQAQPFDVLINEIMADPTPPVGLPETEFVELHNTTSSGINLDGWKFSDAATEITLPSVILPADSFLILCDEADTTLFQPFGITVGVNLPALNNSGDDLTLKDSTAQTIHTINYTSSWYRDDDKDDGGWTLEQIEPNALCRGAANWIASTDASGGTPGRKNSVTGVFVDTTSPNIVSVAVLSPTSIELTFDEQVDTAQAKLVSNYTIDNGVGQPLTATPQNPDFTNVVLQFSPQIDSGTLYTVTASNIGDCFSNSGSSDGVFVVTFPIDSGDLVINEILFNPLSGGVDYVEIYNQSDKILDLNGLEIVEADPDNIVLDNAMITEQILSFPGSYIALTSDPDIVRSQYSTPNPDSVILVSSFPNWPDDEGIVRIQLDTNNILDEVLYSDDWHFALIDDENGVSLERLRFDGPSNDPDNWFSAASTVGFGTPAYQNSHFNAGITTGDVSVDPEVFSPDQDGFNDLLTINYEFPDPGYVANVIVFDAQGRIVRHLVTNELLESTGFFTWDGLDDGDQKVRMGIYIVWFEVFNLTGQVERYKLPCVVGGRL